MQSCYNDIMIETKGIIMKKHLSSREFDIMCILWNSDKPLTATGILEQDSSFKTVTVQTCLKKLLENDYVKVAEIIQVGKSFARTYLPVVTAEEYLSSRFASQVSGAERKIAFSKGMIAALLNDEETDEEVIDELEAFIKERKEQLKNS